MKTTQDYELNNHTIMVYIENETKLWRQLGKVHSITKTTQDNDVIDRIGVVYTENDTKLLELIKQGAICDENLIR